MGVGTSCVTEDRCDEILEFQDFKQEMQKRMAQIEREEGCVCDMAKLMSLESQINLLENHIIKLRLEVMKHEGNVSNWTDSEEEGDYYKVT